MGALPSSNLPGLQDLHDRVITALELGKETREIEFKESAPWDNLKQKIAKTALAMGNLTDGGLIIVGVSERGATMAFEGIREADLPTFNPDIIIDFVNKYASPPITLDAVLVKHNEKQYVAIRIREFNDTPYVAKRNGDGIQRGAFYVRPTGKAETKKVSTAAEMHDLLKRAAEKRAREILEQAHRIGFALPSSQEDPFDQELNGL